MASLETQAAMVIMALHQEVGKKGGIVRKKSEKVTQCSVVYRPTQINTQIYASYTELYLHTAVLDLLEAEGLHLLVVRHVLALGEAKGVVAVVTRDAALLIPLAVKGDALEPAGEEEDLKESGDRDHLDGIEGSGSGNVGEGDARRGREEPGLVGGGVEGVRAGGAEVEGEVDAELLDHEADGGNHGDATVLDLGVLEPLDGVGVRVLEDPGAEGRALVAGLDGDTEGIVDRGGGEGRGGLAGLSGGRKGGGRAKDGGEAGGSLHCSNIVTWWKYSLV